MTEPEECRVTWGPWLFVAVAAALAVFFWWLLIHSGGVGGHGG